MTIVTPRSEEEDLDWSGRPPAPVSTQHRNTFKTCAVYTVCELELEDNPKHTKSNQHDNLFNTMILEKHFCMIILPREPDINLSSYNEVMVWSESLHLCGRCSGGEFFIGGRVHIHQHKWLLGHHPEH